MVEKKSPASKKSKSAKLSRSKNEGTCCCGDEISVPRKKEKRVCGCCC